MSDMMLSGAIPEPPTILCKDEETQYMVQHTLHQDWSKRPSTRVIENWPDEWRHVNAVLMMPILVLGTEKPTSFSIIGDVEIEPAVRNTLNAYINLIRTSGVPPVSYRDIARATGKDRRTVSNHLRKLTDAGIGVYKYGSGFTLDIGKWVLDAKKAAAMGIEIEEYRV